MGISHDSCKYQNVRSVVFTIVVHFSDMCMLVLAVVLVITVAPKGGPPVACNYPQTHFLHRGNVSTAPENSRAAAMAALEAGMGCEVDVSVSADGVPFLFHDSNTERLTGFKADVSDVDFDVIAGLTYTKMQNNMRYMDDHSIVSLAEFLNEACRAHPNGPLYLDVKDMRTEANVANMIQVIERSPCKQTLILSSPYLSQLRQISREVGRYGSNVLVAFYMHPGTLPRPMSIHFLLKSRLVQMFYGWPSILSLHYMVYEKEVANIMGYNEDRFCLGIYGGRPDEMLRNEWTNALSTIHIDLPGVRWGDLGSKNVDYTSDAALWVSAICLLIACGTTLFLRCVFVFRKAARSCQYIRAGARVIPVSLLH